MTFLFKYFHFDRIHVDSAHGMLPVANRSGSRDSTLSPLQTLVIMVKDLQNQICILHVCVELTLLSLSRSYFSEKLSERVIIAEYLSVELSLPSL